jgi:MFS family permease
MASQVGAIAHQYGLITQRLPEQWVAIALTVLPLASVIGRLAGGFLLDKLPVQGFTLVMMLAQAFSLGLLSLSETIAGMLLGLAILGITVGNLLMLQPLIIAARYGLRSYSRLFSWANLFSVLGVAAGPGLLGWLFGWSGSYAVPFMVAAGLAGLAGLTFCFCLGSQLEHESVGA